jgi:pilus assembly protein CpaE
MRLVVIDSDRRTRIYVERCLGENGVRIIGEAEDVSSGLRLVRGLHPDAVLMELPANASETVEAIQKIREELPDTGIILSSYESSPQLILSCVRAGAQEFLSRPIDTSELQKAMEHIRKLAERSVGRARHRGTILTVFSGKGGVGTTSVVANLGVALANRGDARTILVDMSFQMGDLGLMLDQPPRYSLPDAFDGEALSETKLQSVMSQHGSGAYVMTVAASPEIAEGITRHHVAALLGTLTNMFDYIVVDVGRHLDDRTFEALEISDAIMMMSMQDVPTIRNVSRYLEIMDRLEVERDKIKLLINRYQKKNRLTLRDVEAALDLETFWAIPNDFHPVSLGIDGGVPAVIEAPRSKVAQSFKDLADSVCDTFGTQSLSEDVSLTTTS